MYTNLITSDNFTHKAPLTSSVGNVNLKLYELRLSGEVIIVLKWHYVNKVI